MHGEETIVVMGRGHGHKAHNHTGTMTGWSHHTAMAFWLVTMKEHAMFMMNGLDCDRMDLKEKAREYMVRYDGLLDSVNRMGSHGHGGHQEHMRMAKELTESFVDFKECLLSLLVTCRMGHCGGMLTPSFLMHLISEGKHFLGFLSKPHDWRPDTKNRVAESAYWMPDFREHSEQIRSLLDRSEAVLIDKAGYWIRSFTELGEQAVEVNEMVKASGCVFPKAMESLAQTMHPTRELRAFKLHLARLLAECKALGLLTPALANHMAREALYYLDFVG